MLETSETEFDEDSLSRKVQEKFEKLFLELNDNDLNAVLEQTGREDLCIALKGVHSSVRKRLSEVLPKDKLEMLYEDYAYSGPVRLSDVIAAMTKIIEKTK